jgi:hypothetical protein
MMNKAEETDSSRIKKEWLPPSFQIIPFKHTQGGPHESTNEDDVYLDPLS